MSHSYVEIFIHIIFSTKNHAPFLRPELEQRLYPYIVGIARKKGIIINAINGATDHVHILLKLNSISTIAKTVSDLKCLSSGKMGKEGWPDFKWQEGYGAFSCSQNHAEKVQTYIRNQKEHHKKITYKEEIKRLSEIWGISWYDDLINKE